LALTDATAVTALNGKIQAAETTVRAAFSAYEPLISDDKDRALLAADRSAFEAYDALIRSALVLAAQNHKVEARDMLLDHQNVIELVLSAMEAHVKYNADLGVAGAAEGLRVKATAMQMEWAIGALLGALVLILAFIVTRSLTGQLGGEPADVAAVANRVALGDLSSTIVLRAGDTTSLFAAVAKMQERLQERADADRARSDSERERVEGELATAAENVRVRIALDRVSVGVMLADNDGKIIYVNDFGINIFRLRAPEIRKNLPQFDPERIIGSSFDSFHRIPSHQRNLLAGLKATHTVDIKMGDATLRVIANPVLDTDGKRLGTVVQWVDRTQEIAIEEEVQETVAAAIEGNMTAQIREEGKEGFFKTLASGMNRLVGNMAEVLQTISGAAAQVGTGAEEISRGNADLSQRTEEQASSLEQTASSMEQMTSAVKNNADNAAQASHLAMAARDQAERGGAVVQSAITAMSEINASSKKIADIIGVIDDIAFQTNLLALNAAVEAARAGEQGRGFAVVASEVRNLASRSAAAAKEIKSLIQESVGKVEDGSKFVDASGQVLREIVVGIKKVTDMVAEIAASSQEQASGIEQVNKAVMSMDEVTQQNAALVEEATAAAQSLNEQAASLTQLMARFEVGSTSIKPSSVEKRVTGVVAARNVVSGAAAVERRDPKRPWAKSGKSPASAESTSATTATSARNAAGGGAPGDSGWSQF
jgi:methyl-accepting chemotaxis protein